MWNYYFKYIYIYFLFVCMIVAMEFRCNNMSFEPKTKNVNVFKFV